MAQTAKYRPGDAPGSGGTVTGVVKVEKIQNLIGSDLEAYLNDGSIDVVRNKDGDKTTRLQGVPILVSISKKDNEIHYTGTCYWRSGPDREALSGKNTDQKELVLLKDGTTLVGKIENVSCDSIELTTPEGRQKVSVQNVKEIKSPFATRFNCVIVSPESNVSFQSSVEGPTSIQFTKTFDRLAIKQTKTQKVTSGDGMSTKTKVILGVVAAVFIATAIAVPLAVAIPVANQNRRQKNATRNQENLFLQNLLQQQQQQNQNQNQN